MKISETDFFRAQETLQNIPFTQAKGWHDSFSQNQQKVYFVDNADKPTLAVWGRIFQIPLIGKILQIQGEAFSGENNSSIESLYREIAQDDYAMILLSSLRQPQANLEISLRNAGYLRPFGNTLCPLTIMVNIQEPEKRRKAWKTNLKKAVDLDFIHCHSFTSKDLNDFEVMFQEMAQKKNMNYTISAADIQKLLQDDRFQLYLVKTKEGTTIAGRIIYIHNGIAEDVFASNANSSRNNGASYFILEKIFENLKEQGVSFFDFGRIAPGTTSTNSVYEFKKFSGGKPVQYFGEWVWAKNPYIELLYLIYRQFLKHGARY